MINFIRNLWISFFGNFFDTGELILGLILGILLSWLYGRLEPIREWISNWSNTRLQLANRRQQRAALDEYRMDLVKRAQVAHAAGPIFALDEIAITPKVLAPPMPADENDRERMPEDTLSVLPNLPDWKYLSAVYQSPTLDLHYALRDGANLLLTGWPGSGKSTALAYLAMLMALRDPALGDLASFLPVWIHAADLVLDRAAEKDPLKPIENAILSSSNGSGSNRMVSQVQTAFKRGEALLLLDGLDEFSPSEIPPIAAWLTQLQKKYSGVRMIVAAHINGYDGLTELGLTPIPIAPWTDHDQLLFQQRWSAAWTEHVAPALPRNRISDIDPALLTGWMVGSMRGKLPLDITLHTWAAYIGDVRGNRSVDSLESYLARFLSINERKSAQASALAWIQTGSGLFSERIIKRGTPLAEMEQAGLVRRHVQGRLTFASANVGAYLAARALTESGESLDPVPIGWAPGELTLRYLAAMADVGPVASTLIQQANDPLEKHLLAVARWLADAPRKQPWRGDILRKLAQIAADGTRAYGLRLRCVHALACSRENSVAILFRRLLSSDNPTSRVLGALGLGGLRDEESVKQLLETIHTKRNLHTRRAACLALAAIGTDEALEGLGHILLESDEGVQIAAAEALACNPTEGFSMLRDAAEMKNLLTRRAAVFGLGRVPEPWAIEILETMQMDDDQWVVRGAAAEILKQWRNPPWKVEPQERSLTDLPWLKEFASKEGMAVASDRAALDLVRRALTKGSQDEQIAALEAIVWAGADDLSLELSQALSSPQPHLRDAAYEALYQMDAAGIPVRDLVGKRA
ncbi:MAG: HEAT repeat domain-containing protein [Anaerolineales bacterium]